MVGVALAVLGYLMSGRMERKEAAELVQPEAPAEADMTMAPSETDYL